MSALQTTSGEGSALCQVRLQSFEGPLDLLIHLVRTESIDLTDISLSDVVRQYDQYVDLMARLDLEAAGDSLVIVAALVHMKSRRLLPPEPGPVGLESPDGRQYSEDPPEARQAVRQVAEHLQEREALMEMVYSRAQATVAEYAGEQGIEADLFSLLRAFQAILRRLGNDAGSRVTRERITLVERMNWLMETLERQRRIGFRALFAEATDRVTCILTFLALLEVIRLRLVRAYQSHHQEDILISLFEETPLLPSLPEDRLHV